MYWSQKSYRETGISNKSERNEFHLLGQPLPWPVIAYVFLSALSHQAHNDLWWDPNAAQGSVTGCRGLILCQRTLTRCHWSWWSGINLQQPRICHIRQSDFKRNVMARVLNIFKTLLSEQISEYKALLWEVRDPDGLLVYFILPGTLCSISPPFQLLLFLYPKTLLTEVSGIMSAPKLGLKLAKYFAKLSFPSCLGF